MVTAPAWRSSKEKGNPCKYKFLVDDMILYIDGIVDAFSGLLVLHLMLHFCTLMFNLWS
jgi:hypothetical protein